MRGRRAAAAAFVALALTACTTSTGQDTGIANRAPSSGALPTGTDAPQPTAPQDVATGLDVPWGVVVLPDQSLLVSERDTAKVQHVGTDGAVRTVGTVPGVVPAGEAGLLGIAVDPATFSASPVLFAYFTAQSDNRVVSIPLTGGTSATGLGPPTVLVDGIPKAGNHDGGRLAFGPDGFLYVTTGDATQRDASQDLGSLGGKILRFTSIGAPAPGNPFPGSRVWSYGHRNVQGIAWDSAGRMWATEFGQDTWDELNLVEPGKNYGWPTVEGAAARPEFVDPVRQWATDDASPSGLAVGPASCGCLLMAALRGESLWKIPLAGDGTTGEPQRLLQGRFGRLRDVFVGADGNAWVVTNNTARGTARPGDDRIVRLPRSVTG